MFLSIFVFIILPVLICLILHFIYPYIDYTWDTCIDLIQAVFIIIWVAILIILPVYRIDIKAKIAGYNEMQQTYNNLRVTAEEKTAIGLKIMECNKELAELKEVANITVLKIFFPEEIYTQDFIK